MFNSKEYHKEYMRKYRKNVVSKSPEKMERIRELDNLRYYRRKKDPQKLENYRKWHREWIRKKRKNNPKQRKLETKQHKRYINTEKGKKSIRKSIDKYCKKNPIRVKAWSATTYAKKVGKIKKLPCKFCGKIKGVHAHHPDPRRQLEVVFLCPLHHKQEHIKSNIVEAVIKKI